MKIKIVLAACISVAAAYTHAAVIQVNFGSTPVDPPTNSPYHTSNGAFTDTTWNQANGVGDINPGVVPDPGALLYSDGTAATGVSVDIGFVANGWVMDFDTQPTQSRTLTAQVPNQSGAYALAALRSTIFGGTNGQQAMTGVRVDGLAAGQYQIYAWGTNVGGTLVKPMVFHAAAASSATTFDFNDVNVTSSGNLYLDDPYPAVAWADGINYALLTVTISAGESIYLASQGVGDAVHGNTETRGFLSGMQIVAVPEPTTYALFFGLAGLGIVMMSRYRSRR